nr:FG-GAP-like repeat-containing protein [Segetibacter sp. 3557_3]
MKRNPLLLVFFLTVFLKPTFAQHWTEMMKDHRRFTFREVVQAFEKEQARVAADNLTVRKSGPEGKEDGEGKGGEKIFRRYKWFWEQRVDQNGNYPDEQRAFKEWKAFEQTSNGAARGMANSPAFTSKGPTSHPGGYGGLGHMRQIAFHPTNPNIFYAVSNGGHVWKTTNGGLNYVSLTDFLPAMYIVKLIVDQQNPDRLVFIKNTGREIYESLDGGATWHIIDSPWVSGFQDLYQNPDKPNQWFLVENNHLHRSEDGGRTYLRSGPIGPNVNGGITNLMVRPGSNGKVLYGTLGWDPLYFVRSIDGGLTWTATAQIAVGSARVAVCPTAPNLVMVCVSNGAALEGIYKSTDGGSTFAKTYTATPSGNLFSPDYPSFSMNGQAWWGFTYEINPLNPNQHFCGSINNYRSNDGGLTWQILTTWYNMNVGASVTHADKHFLKYNPFDLTKLYECNDGGIYRSLNNGTTWTNISNGLVTSEIYRVSTPHANATNPYHIIGTQDNGTKILQDNGNWFDQLGGDGMDSQIDPVNSNTCYTSYQNGVFVRSDQANNNYEYISNNIPGGRPTGDWVTPIALDTSFRTSPTQPASVYLGYANGIWKSMNKGTTWRRLPNNYPSIIPKILTVVDSSKIIVSDGYRFLRTTNGGNSWVAATGLNQELMWRFASVVVDPTDFDKMWVTNGHPYNGKVFFSDNGGVSWQDISYNLPYGTYNSIVIDFESPAKTMYVSSDNGIAYKALSDNSWSVYGTGLPYVGINEIQLDRYHKQLVVGTYGRGFWSVPLPEPQNEKPILTTSAGITNSAATNLVDTLVSIADVNNTTLASATIAISKNFSAESDQLGFAYGGTNLHGNITSTYNSGSGVLSLVSNGATATLVQWQNALRSVYHQSITISPAARQLTMSFVVNDGHADSDTAYKIFELAPGILAEAPVITSVSPIAAPKGTSIEVSGTNFNQATSGNVVYFGAVRAHVSNASPTSLTVSVPTGSIHKPITVLNHDNGLSGSSTRFFVPTFNNPFTTGLPANFFQPKSDLLTGSDRSVAIGDLDGDGKAEVVTLGSGAVRILRNITTAGSTTLGASAFEPAVNFPVNYNVNYQNLFLADVDGDGKLDIIVGNHNDARIAVFRNTSTPGGITPASFAAKIEYPVNGKVEALAVSDLDGDGRPDIVALTRTTLSVFSNRTIKGLIDPGSFYEQIIFSGLPLNELWRAVTKVTDVDGDGKPDIITHTGVVNVFRNNSVRGVINATSFQPPVNLNLTRVKSFDIADVDQDGKMDFVCITDSRLSPDGQISGRILISHNVASPGNITTASFSPPVEFFTPYEPWSFTFDDFDGDSKPDLAISCNSKIALMRNTSVPGSITTNSLAYPVDFNATVSTLESGDVDGDGIPELFSTTWIPQELHVYKINNAANAITFNGKVFLQGNFNALTGNMTNSLNTLGILADSAKSQPFNDMLLKYSGTEHATPDVFKARPGIVDWVLVELRSTSSPSLVLGRRAALLTQNGTLVDIDGVTPGITFQGFLPGEYHVSIRHRNHLGIRSATPLDFTSGSAGYDFTTAADKCFQNQPYTSTVSMAGVWAMRAGNANGNNNVKYNGPQNDQDRIQNIKLGGSLSLVQNRQYAPEDINLDGTIKTNGPANDQNFLLNAILTGLLSSIYTEQL